MYGKVEGISRSGILWVGNMMTLVVTTRILICFIGGSLANLPLKITLKGGSPHLKKSPLKRLVFQVQASLRYLAEELPGVGNNSGKS